MKSLFKKIVVFIITLEARLVLKKYKPKVIGITGSVGKTSTKDAITQVLDSHFYVRGSEKSHNSEIGIPLTILGVGNAWGSVWGWMKNITEGLLLLLLKNHYPEWLVLELGADAPGDISRTVSWLTLDVAVLTRIGELPVHVEFFDSIEALIHEKWSIADGLKEGGTLILNHDDPNVLRLKEKQEHYTITYGMDEGAGIRGTYLKPSYRDKVPTGMTFNAEEGGDVVPFHFEGVVGRQHVYPALAAVATGKACGINMIQVAHALSKRVGWAPGRMRLLEGIKGAVVIDDSYNSSPVALEEALRTLKGLEGGAGRKIAILGDMMELGDHTEKAHEKGGKDTAEVADVLITVGPRAEGFKVGAEKAGMKEENIYVFADSWSAAEKVPSLVKEGDIVLIKGSQSPRLERITKVLLAHPENAPRLLVRQEKEWERR